MYLLRLTGSTTGTQRKVRVLKHGEAGDTRDDEASVVGVVVYKWCSSTSSTPLLNVPVVLGASCPQALHLHNPSTISRWHKQSQSHRGSMGDIRHEVNVKFSSRDAHSFAPAAGNIKQAFQGRDQEA